MNMSVASVKQIILCLCCNYVTSPHLSVRSNSKWLLVLLESKGTHTYTHTHTYTCMHTHAYTHTHACTRTHTHIHTHAHAGIHTYTHVHTRAHKHEHIHAYLSASWFILGIEHLAPLPYSFPCSLLYFLSCSHTISSCFASRLCALNATQDKEAKEYLLANFVPALEVSCAYVCACVY
jgi:hypothetical protein